MKAPALLLLSATGFFALLGSAIAQVSPAAPSDSISAPLKEPLTGTVLDEMNNPLAGVTVKLQGGLVPQICITNGRGKYLLQVPTTGGSIDVSFEGYISQQISFRRVNEIDFVLQPQPGFRRERKERVIYRRHNKALGAYPNQ